MAEEITIKVKVNAETGKLEVVGKQFDKTGKKAKQTEKSFKGLTVGTAALLKGFALLGGATAVIGFFSNAILGAEEMTEKMRRLRFAIEATGQAWDDNRKSAEDWITAVQVNTRFTDTTAVASLERFVRVTGDLEQAMTASQISMGLHVQSGKSLQFTNDLVADTINRSSGALSVLQRRFASIIPEGNDFQKILDTLNEKVGELIFSEEGLTANTAKLRDTYERVRNTIGDSLEPTLIKFVGFLRGSVVNIAKLTVVVSSSIRVMLESFKTLKSFAKDALTFDFKGIKERWKEHNEIIKDVNKDLMISLGKINDDFDERQANRNKNRLLVSEGLKATELAKIEAMEIEMDTKLIQLGEQTLEKKVQLLNLETAKRRSAINQQVTDEKSKQKLLLKLSQLELKQKKQLAKAEIQTKTAVSFQIAKLAIQTLQTINSMGEKGSSAERVRAKALLALQQSIAIGWAWVHAMKAGGPLGIGLAVATTALLVAQFAQQSRAIDRAASAESAGIGALNVRGPVPGIDAGPPAGIDAGDELFDGGGGARLGTGGGGGGRGQTLINVGGVVVNVDVEKLGLDNVDAVMNQITEAVRRGTIEGVQLAINLKNAADANSALAV